MGYRRQPKVYRLTFTGDEEYDGLEVMVRGLPVGEFLSLAKRLSSMDEKDPDMDEIERVFAVFADKLIGWNLEDAAGVKVPANLHGVKAQDLDFAMVLIKAWVDNMGGVDPELGKGSNSGGTFPEVDIPTEALSGSLVS